MLLTSRVTHKVQGKRNCGQTCVAMIANTTIGRIETLCGKRGGTHATHLISALRWLNIPCSWKCERLRLKNLPLSSWIEHLPDFGIIRVQYVFKEDNWKGHWILKDGPWIHDPSFTQPFEYSQYMTMMMHNRQFTSFIRINR